MHNTFKSHIYKRYTLHNYETNTLWMQNFQVYLQINFSLLEYYQQCTIKFFLIWRCLIKKYNICLLYCKIKSLKVMSHQIRPFWKCYRMAGKVLMSTMIADDKWIFNVIPLLVAEHARLCMQFSNAISQPPQIKYNFFLFVLPGFLFFFRVIHKGKRLFYLTGICKHLIMLHHWFGRVPCSLLFNH